VAQADVEQAGHSDQRKLVESRCETVPVAATLWRKARESPVRRPAQNKKDNELKKINNKKFKTLANWKIVSIFAPRFLDEIAKGLKKQIDRWIH